MKWSFTPFNLTAWNGSKERVLFVATKPNGNNPNSGNPDMGDWFRTAKSSNKYHNNRKFHNRCKIILKGILSSTNEKEIFSHFRFMDLKATQGGAKSFLNQVMDYVNSNLEEVLEYFLSNDKKFSIAPTIAVILGNTTQDVFEHTVKPILIKKNTTLNHVYMHHPSAQTVVIEHLVKASSEITSKLAPISSIPFKWFCKGRKNYGWTIFK